VFCVRAWGGCSDWPACAKSSEKICFLSALRVAYIESEPADNGHFLSLSRGSVLRRVCIAWCASQVVVVVAAAAADSHIKAPPALIETQMPIKRRIMAAQCQKGAVNCTRRSILFCHLSLCICLSLCALRRKRDGGVEHKS
jgi:hypothetical protein